MLAESSRVLLWESSIPEAQQAQQSKDQRSYWTDELHGERQAVPIHERTTPVVLTGQEPDYACNERSYRAYDHLVLHEVIARSPRATAPRLWGLTGLAILGHTKDDPASLLLSYPGFSPFAIKSKILTCHLLQTSARLFSRQVLATHIGRYVASQVLQKVLYGC